MTKSTISNNLFLKRNIAIYKYILEERRIEQKTGKDVNSNFPRWGRGKDEKCTI